EHVISRAALKAISRGADRRDIITLEAALLDLDTLPALGMAPAQQTPISGDIPASLPLRQQVELLQRRAIDQALRQHSHNQAAAARALGLDASNLRKLMQRLGLNGRA